MNRDVRWGGFVRLRVSGFSSSTYVRQSGRFLFSEIAVDVLVVRSLSPAANRWPPAKIVQVYSPGSGAADKTKLPNRRIRNI